MENDRRDFLKKGAMLAIAGLGTQLFSGNLSSALGAAPLEDQKEFTLPPLPYAYDALEPVIDKMTMEIHHTKHHQAYVNNLNKALKEANAPYTTLEMLIAHAGTYSPAVRNNAGGHWNHSFFWKIMKPGGGGAPQGKLADAIIASFNTMDEFKTKFNEAGTKRFGSGWAWLYLDNNKKLAIGSTPNQDNPMMDISDIKGIPIMGVDVWEHAYYLKYQNRRPEYLAAWWNVLNWDEIAHNFEIATK